MRPRSLIGLEWMDGTEDETSGCSDAFDTEKGVVSINLPLKWRDLWALSSRSAQVRAVMYRERRVRSSIKARSKGNAVLLLVNLGTLACIEYSSIMFIPAKKRIMERVQPEKIPCWCLCQELVADCWLRKWFTENPFVICFNESDPLKRDTLSMMSKSNQFMGDGLISIYNVQTNNS